MNEFDRLIAFLIQLALRLLFICSVIALAAGVWCFRGVVRTTSNEVSARTFQDGGPGLVRVVAAVIGASLALLAWALISVSVTHLPIAAAGIALVTGAVGGALCAGQPHQRGQLESGLIDDWRRRRS